MPKIIRNCESVFCDNKSKKFSKISGDSGGLLDLCDWNALGMVRGSSKPLSPVLFDYGANVIAESRVREENAVLHCMEQGSTFQQVAGVMLPTVANS